MCRFLLVKSENTLAVQELLNDFADMCEESRAPDGDRHGDGWGVAWLQSGRWQQIKSLNPIWENKIEFEKIPPVQTLAVHARSASFPNQKGVLDYNQPFVENDTCFVFNGLIEGVRISPTPTGKIGAQKIFSLFQRFKDLGLVFKTIRENSRKIKGMNVGVIQNDKIYAMSTYTQNPEYFTLHQHKDSEKTLISSEPFGNFNWEKLEKDRLTFL
jgi:predicted glutamine amidotransferase